MGWLFGWDSRSELKKHILDPNQTKSLTIIDHASTKIGRNLWVVYEKNETKERFIALYLIQKSGGSYGYKGIDESMGPVEVDCPLKLLNKVESTPINEYSDKWRERVRNFHSRRQIDLKPDMIVSIYGSNFRLVEKMNRSSWIVERLSDGARFKSTPAKMRLEA